MKKNILLVFTIFFFTHVSAQKESVKFRLVQFLNSLKKEHSSDSVNCFAVKFRISKKDTIEYCKIFYESKDGYDSLTNNTLLCNYSVSDLHDLIDTKKNIYVGENLFGLFILKDVETVRNPSSELQFSADRIEKILKLFAFTFDPVSLMLSPVIVFVEAPLH